MSSAWSSEELELIIADYFSMLLLELNGQRYNKSEHRNRLMSLLPGRSKASIEMKHQNISAVLNTLRFPFIHGYKPLTNYQEALLKSVVFYLDHHQPMVEGLLNQVNQAVALPTTTEQGLLHAMEAPPEPLRPAPLQEEAELERLKSPVARHVDFAAMEERNRSLGEAGEQFVLKYEHARLYHLGQKTLAERVEQVSKTQGDGLGYDILSWETNGQERLIEVKTTAAGPYTPFYVTANELLRSTQRSEQYYLYRVYQIRVDPRLFALKGSLSHCCRLLPTQYRATAWHG